MTQPAGSQVSVGSDADAVWHVLISTSTPSVPYVEVGVLVEDAVAGVQVRRQTGPVAGHGGGGVVAHDRLVQGVVGRGRGDLPGRAVEHGLGCRVVVDEELEADPRHEAVEGLGLGLGGGTGSSIGLAATVR